MNPRSISPPRIAARNQVKRWIRMAVKRGETGGGRKEMGIEEG
jgi:hypothetical protein